jgi:hypothetical protein
MSHEEMKHTLRALFKRILILCLILALMTLLLLQWTASGISERIGPFGLAFVDLIVALSGGGWYGAKSGIGAQWVYVKVLVGIASAAVAALTLACLLFVVAMVPGSLPHGGSGGGHHHSHFD